VDIIKELKSYGAIVDVYDPWIDADEAEHEYGLRPVKKPAKGKYDAIIAAVKHNQFASMTAAQVRALCKEKAVVYDIKRVLPRSAVDAVL
jgi:UDP-N-acetyl-D-galactosamine dehydrogenase